MLEILSKVSSNDLAPLLGIGSAVVVAGIVAITAIIAANVRKYRVAELDASLKQEMLSRGMSAQDIEQVICAKSDSKSWLGCKRRPQVDRVA
jgi:galactokinase/mevalonate kinase-like predicted kinase